MSNSNPKKPVNQLPKSGKPARPSFSSKKVVRYKPGGDLTKKIK